MKKVIIVIVLILPLLWFVMPEQKIISDDSDPVEIYLPALMQEVAIPGLVVAKVSTNEIKTYAFGNANIATNTLVSEDTLFNIASLSKPIMGVVLLQLVDQGKLELDRDINDYLPFIIDNPHINNETITLRHLATHTSGIADYYDISSYAENKDSSISLEQHLKSLLTSSGSNYNNGQHYLNYAPGTQRQYSNLAAGLAGYLVEAVTGLSLAEYSKQTLFDQLGMHQTSWLLHDLPLDNIAVPYEVETCIPYLFICSDTESPKLNYLITEYVNPPLDNKQYHPYPHFGNPQYPDGGVRTSIKELSQFLSLLMQNKDADGKPILSDNMFNELLKLQLPEEVSTRQRFFLRDNSSGLTGHMGSDLGVFTAMYFDIKSKAGYIILMNRGADNKAGSAMKKIVEKLMQ